MWISNITSGFNKVFQLTAPGLGTGTSPVNITHLTCDVSTATGVLNFPSLKLSLMADTLYAHTADTWDKLLETPNHPHLANTPSLLFSVISMTAEYLLDLELIAHQ